MKVMLLFPPNWTPSMPHLSMPTLAAYLRPQGIQVIQRDLNLEVFDEILTRTYMENALDHLRQDYGSQANKQPARPALPARQKVLWALQEGPGLATKVEQAKQVIRSEAFFDGPAGLQAIETVIKALEIASLPFY